MIQNSDKKPNLAKRDAAERIAIAALGYLAADAQHLERFLSLSGLDPADLRQAAAAPGFFAGLLDFILEDESLLLAFAADHGINPTEILRARSHLAQPHEEGLREG